MPDEEDLLIICLGLVSVAPREANEMTKGFWARKDIRLAHASVKDYLLSDRVHETFKPEFEKFHGETCIVNHSLHYLTHVNEDFSKQKQGRPDSTERRSTYDQLQEEFTEKLRIELVKVGQMMRFEEELEAVSILIDEVSEDEDKDIWLEIEEEDQVRDIAKRCTIDSTPDEFKTSQRRSETPRSTWQTISRRITKKYPLARYASNVWTLYAKAVEEASSLLMTEFFNQKGIVLFNWYGLCYLSDRWERHGISKLDLPRSGPPPLYCAALLGLERCVRLMLERGLDAQVYMWPYGTPLQAAAAEGHIEIVKMLLDAGAVDKNDVSTGKTALQAACIKRHDDIIKLLISSGARVA